MLHLRRKKGQSIVIGDDIVITYLKDDQQYPDQIVIGIEAPKHVKISREEILGKNLDADKA